MKIVLDTTLGEMTFDVEPVIYGKWKLVRPGVYECSECGRRVETGLYAKLEDFPYCHCGAKMTEGPDNRILYLKRGK